MSEQHAKVLIIGSGPAGYTAAIYAARAMLKPILISGYETGGQLMITTDIENFPGFAEPVNGPWLMEQMQQQAKNAGAQLIEDYVTEVELNQAPFRIKCDSGKLYTCDSVIIATGAQARWLGLPSEEKYRGRGVSACATCDGFFYKDRKVVVVGGGNAAVEDALYLANMASHVVLVHRRDSLRAEKVLQERLFAHPKISVIWNSVVEEIYGEGDPEVVTGIGLKNVQTNKVERVDTDGVFVAIGHKPATELFAGQLKMKTSGYLITEAGRTQTQIPGVFAAGDVADDMYRQAVTAAGMGCMAALEAEHYLLELDLLSS